MYTLLPEHVPNYFTGSKQLYRILADGTYKEVSFVESGRLLVTYGGERIYGPDIAWCLHYGNWPKFPLVQLDGDPFNCSIDNIMPARVNRLRYREVVRDSRFHHPLSSAGFATPTACRRDWAAHARDHYMKDLDYVLRLEAEERALRKHVPPAPLPARRVSSRVAKPQAMFGKPKRPAPVEGMEWHWYEGAWLSVPVACHVADDYLVRIQRWLRGARRFEFNKTYGEVWAFREDGTVVR